MLHKAGQQECIGKRGSQAQRARVPVPMEPVLSKRVPVPMERAVSKESAGTNVSELKDLRVPNVKKPEPEEKSQRP